MILENKVIYQNGAIREFEKPEVCEAIKVANANKWVVGLSPTEWDERKARLKKEYEENTKAPGSAENSIKGDLSGNKSIEHCGEPIPGSPLSAVEGIKLKWKDNQNTSENPALKESASQFNDALLEEQAKEIESLRDKCKKYADILDSVGDKLRELKAENRRIKDSDLNLEGLTYATRELKEKNKEIAQLTKENEDLKSWRENQNKEISRLNKIINKKNLKIEELGKESSRHLEGKMKMFGENFDLEQKLKDKDAVLADVAEELRLSKIREKNLTEVCQKYMKEKEEVKKKLASKIVDKIDAQALKSAESALAYKEKVIAEKDMALAYYEKQLAEKDEVIADLDKELAATKKALDEKTKLVEIVRNGSKEYCDYGVAANEFIKELAHLYVLASNNGNIDVEMLERCKNYQTYGFPANCNRETKKEINDIVRGKENKKPRIPTPEEPKHDNGFKDFKNKTIGNYNRRAAELGCAGSKDGNGIFDQMVGTDIAEEGGDNSGVTVLCGKDCIDDIIKKMK